MGATQSDGVDIVSLVVQKYGGSSVSDADALKRVAKRIVDTKKAGNDVVVVVSAMGDTTDELLDLASLPANDLYAVAFEHIFCACTHISSQHNSHTLSL